MFFWLVCPFVFVRLKPRAHVDGSPVPPFSHVLYLSAIPFSLSLSLSWCSCVVPLLTILISALFTLASICFFRKLPTDGCSFHMSKIKVIDWSLFWLAIWTFLLCSWLRWVGRGLNPAELNYIFFVFWVLSCEEIVYLLCVCVCEYRFLLFSLMALNWLFVRFDNGWDLCPLIVISARLMWWFDDVLSLFLSRPILVCSCPTYAPQHSERRWQ